MGNDGAEAEIIVYNLLGGNQNSVDATTTALPASWTHASYSTARLSVYATYEVGIMTTTAQRLVKLMGKILRIKGGVLRIK